MKLKVYIHGGQIIVKSKGAKNQQKVYRAINNTLFECQSHSLPEEANIACDNAICGCRYSSFCWISHEKKIIWFENPKVASRSFIDLFKIEPPDIRDILFQVALSDGFDSFEVRILLDQLASTDIRINLERIEEAVAFINLPSAFKHSRNNKLKPKSDFEMVYYRDAVTFNSTYLKFGLVRNPIDRFLSNYYMFSQHQHQKSKLDDLTGYDTANMTMRDFFWIISRYVNHHWVEQSNYLNQGTLDLVVKLDELQRNWAVVRSRLSIKEDLIIKNTTQKTHKELDEDLLNDVYKLYQRDFILYDRW